MPNRAIPTIHSHHLGWNPRQRPALRVAPGDELALELQDASGNRVEKHSDASIIPTLKPENANPLSGPVYIDGAEPGDTLIVDILDFAHADWGWTALIPGFGLLADEFPQALLHISEYDSEGIRFTGEIALPTRPFAGTIGTCPSADESVAAIPPHACGGNMDFAGLRAGSRLRLPVIVPGALFSVGDGHAAQGDGEVCGTAVETRLGINVKFGLEKQSGLAAPRAEIALEPRQPGRALVTTGIAPDLWRACRDAVRFMIDELGRGYGLEPALAYCLISCAGDLGFAQVVNAPNWTVSCSIDRSLFR